MRLPVPNTGSRLVDKAGYILNPWNIWFQSFSQNAPEAQAVEGTTVTINQIGNIFITSGAPVINLIRGNVTIVMTGQKVIPISIGDTVTFAGAYTAEFLGD